MYDSDYAKQPATTGTNFIMVKPCDCNATACPHWMPYTVTVSYAVSDAPLPPKPRPWISRAPVVGAFKDLRLPTWRPRQQRARDGI